MRKLIVVHLELIDRRHLRAVADRRNLPFAPIEQRLGLGGVMSVAVDDGSCRRRGRLFGGDRFDVHGRRKR